MKIPIAGAPVYERLIDEALYFFVDESSQTGHRYLAIGTIILAKRKLDEFQQHLQLIRDLGGQSREMAWKAVGKYKFDVYQEWVRVVEVFMSRRHLRFCVLVLDTSQVLSRVHKQINHGDTELGFSKLLYNLLLHKIGTKYGKTRALHGYLDSRTTQHQPETLRKILNAALAKNHRIDTNPFINLEFMNSKKSNLIQIADVLTGAVAHSRNRKATRPEKIALSEQVMNLSVNPRTARRFDIWPFVYYER